MKKEEKMKNQAELVILAGGLGSRFGGWKQIAPIGENGEPLLHYSISDAQKAGFTKIILITPPSLPQNFLKQLQKIPFQGEIIQREQRLEQIPLKTHKNILKERNKPWGTAQALWCAKNDISTSFALINADDFYGKESFEKMFQALNEAKNENQSYFIAYPLEKTLSPHGKVNRAICKIKNKQLLKITETKGIKEDQGEIFTSIQNKKLPLKADTPVSMNFWGFTPALFPHLEEFIKTFLKNPSNLIEKEMYLPECIQQIIQKKKHKCIAIKSKDYCLGITYPQDLKKMQNHIKKINDAN